MDAAYGDTALPSFHVVQPLNLYRDTMEKSGRGFRYHRALFGIAAAFVFAQHTR